MAILNKIKLKKKITYFQHIMERDSHYCAKIQERKDSKETLNQSKTETPNSASQFLMSKLQLLSLLLTAPHFFLLGCSHSLFVTFLSKYPTNSGISII